MQIDNFLYIIGAVIIALLIAVFHYLYKSKNNKKVNILLTFLRFISLFSLFLLLLNLKFEQEIIKTVKPHLVVAVDNSKSIKYLDGIDENIVYSNPVPFAYETNGYEIYYRDERDPEPRSRALFSFHRPETIAEWQKKEKRDSALYRFS